jgi:flagellar motor switch protein FliN/FliY
MNMSNDTQQSTVTDDWAAAMAEQTRTAAKGPATVTPIDPTPGKPKPGQAALFEKFSGDSGSGSSNHDIDMIMDIPVRLTVELGRTKITIKQILQLAQGSVIELDGLAGEPMDVLVNGCLIAQGEVVVVNDKFGIRLTDIITPSERIRRLNK